MKGNYHEVDEALFASALTTSPSQENKEWCDETGKLWTCWPLANKAHMSFDVHCRNCHRHAHWVEIGSPFGDGQQYFLAAGAYCYWCFPRSNFSEEEQKILSREDWAREQTIREILEMLLKGYESERRLPQLLHNLALEISSTTLMSEALRSMYASYISFLRSRRGRRKRKEAYPLD